MISLYNEMVVYSAKNFRKEESSIITQYNLNAKIYAREIQENSLQSDSFHHLLQLVKKVKDNLSGGIWLDAGCGPGCFSVSDFNRNYTKIIGVDISAEMIKIAKTKKIYSSLHNSSLSDLSFLKEKIDVYFSNNVFHFLNAAGNDYFDKALSEAYRVLKNKGIFAINLSSTGTSDNFVEAYKKIVNKNIRYNGFFDEEDNHLGVKAELIKDYPIGSMELKDIILKIKKAGFEIKFAFKRYEPIFYKNKEEYVRNMSTYAKFLYLTPFEHFSKNMKEKIFREMVELFLEKTEDGPFINDHFMNYIVAVKI